MINSISSIVNLAGPEANIWTEPII